MRVLLALALLGCSNTSTESECVCIGDSGTEMPDAPPYNPLDGMGSVELIQGGFMFTEGPQWTGDKLLFSDIPANTIYQVNNTISVYRMPSGNSNGLAYNGALYAAQHGTRSVTKDDVAIASMFEGKKLNSPNDVIVADGVVYFTDPPYGIQPNQQELTFNGVFMLTDTLTPLYKGPLSARPNGIGISPDNSLIYVDDTDDGGLYMISIATHERTKLAQTSGGADGLAIDAAGNIFVAANAGIDVFSPTGTKWGTIVVPKKPANCAFGDDDHQTLFITAQDSLYKVRLAHPGLPDH